MLRNTITIFLTFLFLGPLSSHAQHVAISNNMFFGLAGAFSGGVEIPCLKKTSLEAYGSIRPWKRGAVNVHKHWLLAAQYRIWPCQVMNGFFYGPYVHYAEFNIGSEDLPFGLLRGLKGSRYEGWLAGAGIGVGYEYALAEHWNIGAEAGVGYAYIKNKEYFCEVCGKMKDKGVYNYVGLSRLALSIIYVF